MKNQKIDLPSSGAITFYNYPEPKLVFSRDISHQQHRKSEFFNRATSLSQTYLSVGHFGSVDFDDWCSHIDSITINLDEEFNPSIEALKLCEITQFDYWKNVLSEFMEAIKEYGEHQKECTQTSRISTESAKRFLFLVPMLAAHKPRIYIDGNNGCFNVDIATRDNGILSTQISDNGHVHYSYVAQNKKIFKISGTAKFKDSRDFIKFNKVLQML